MLNDEDDDQIAAYIDLIILAIVTNMERQHAYRAAPSVQLRHEITEHSRFITNAELCTNVHIQRIIRNFKTSIKYDDLNSNNEFELKSDNMQLANESPTESLTAIATEIELKSNEMQLANESPTESLTEIATEIDIELKSIESQPQIESPTEDTTEIELANDKLQLKYENPTAFATEIEIELKSVESQLQIDSPTEDTTEIELANDKLQLKIESHFSTANENYANVNASPTEIETDFQSLTDILPQSELQNDASHNFGISLSSGVPDQRSRSPFLFLPGIVAGQERGSLPEQDVSRLEPSTLSKGDRFSQREGELGLAWRLTGP